jgi:hypothetical protein
MIPWRRLLCGKWILVLVLLSGPARASDGTGNGGFIPLTLQDMSMDTKVMFRLPVLTADGGTGFYPMLGLRYGLGNVSIGLTVPTAMLMPDVGDSEFAMGNPTLDFAFRTCFQEDTMCFNAGALLGLGMFEFDDLGKLLTVVTGLVATQEYAYYSPETLVAKPAAAFTIHQGMLKIHAEASVAVLVPFYHTDARDTEMAAGYGLAAGIEILGGALTPIVEFKGLTPLTSDDTDSAFWLNLGAQIKVAQIMPFASICFPLNEEAGSELDSVVFFQLGLALLI